MFAFLDGHGLIIAFSTAFLKAQCFPAGTGITVKSSEKCQRLVPHEVQKLIRLSVCKQRDEDGAAPPSLPGIVSGAIITCVARVMVKPLSLLTTGLALHERQQLLRPDDHFRCTSAGVIPNSAQHNCPCRFRGYSPPSVCLGRNPLVLIHRALILGLMLRLVIISPPIKSNAERGSRKHQNNKEGKQMGQTWW